MMATSQGFQAERRIEDFPRGYPRLAALQSSDSVFAVFRRFDTLHVRSLLLAQDELSELENQLWELDSQERVQLYLSSRRHDTNAHRKALLTQIRSTIREYHESLLRYSELSQLDRPRDRDISSFRRWMDAVKPLIEIESGFQHFTEDLVTVPHATEDGSLEYYLERMAQRTGFGRSILQTPVRSPPDPPTMKLTFQKERNKSVDENLHFYSINRRRIVIRLFHTIVACCLLLVPSVLLYLVQNQNSRLAIIVVFVLTFAFVVALFTHAGRHEIFIATATYAAVLVIFIGNVPISPTSTSNS